MLLSTPSLPLVIVAAAVGTNLWLVSSATSAALVASAALAGLVFPAVSLFLLPPEPVPPDEACPGVVPVTAIDSA